MNTVKRANGRVCEAKSDLTSPLDVHEAGWWQRQQAGEEVVLDRGEHLHDVSSLASDIQIVNSAVEARNKYTECRQIMTHELWNCNNKLTPSKYLISECGYPGYSYCLSM